MSRFSTPGKERESKKKNEQNTKGKLYGAVGCKTRHVVSQLTSLYLVFISRFNAEINKRKLELEFMEIVATDESLFLQQKKNERTRTNKM